MRVNPWADAGVACVAQWDRVAAAVDALPDDQFSWPSGLPGWRAADLVAHLSMCAGLAARWVAEPTPDRLEAGVGPYLLGLAAAASAVDEATRAQAVGKTPAELRVLVHHAVDSLHEVVSSTDPARLIPTRLGGMRFDDFLATRCVEGVVHGLDLSPAVDPDPAALRIATRALLAALVVKAPGHTVEVRVPPVAAVQCVEGPRHTRGTPPNVVELDPLTWVRLAAGRLPWTGAAGDGRVRASGERSDISALLPIL